MSKIAINENPEFSTDMDALTPNTPAHADYFNVRFQQVLNNDFAEDDANE